MELFQSCSPTEFTIDEFTIDDKLEHKSPSCIKAKISHEDTRLLRQVNF